MKNISASMAAGQSQPYVSSIPPLFRRGETPLFIPSFITPSVPDIDRYPSSEIHLPRKPGDMFDPSARYRLKTRSHSARMTRCWKIFQCHNSKIFDSQILQWITTRRETKTILSQNQVSWEIRNQQLRVWSEWTVQNDWREGVRSLCL